MRLPRPAARMIEAVVGLSLFIVLRKIENGGL
jgi:hypothetical protein